jgi:hypothetical protein
MYVCVCVCVSWLMQPFCSLPPIPGDAEGFAYDDPCHSVFDVVRHLLRFGRGKATSFDIDQSPIAAFLQSKFTASEVRGCVSSSTHSPTHSLAHPRTQCMCPPAASTVGEVHRVL